MSKKVPVTIMVDPDTGGEFTIKPFADKLAIKAAAVPGGQGDVMPQGFSATATGTNLAGAADVDADVDYSG
jgi:hypothetical protein